MFDLYNRTDVCAKCRFIAFTVTQQNFIALLVRVSGTSRLLHFLFFLLEFLVVPPYSHELDASTHAQKEVHSKQSIVLRDDDQAVP